MVVGCLLFLLEFSLLVHGHTPTFRNEATHPLKAPTESTLGLQINDESIGRTRSNTPKQETYFVGGKHFEYMLLNDSNVLLTSLQNDVLYDAAAVSKEDSFTRSNYIGNKTEENLKPSETQSVTINSNGETNITSRTFTNAAKKERHFAAAAAAAASRNGTSPHPASHSKADQSKINFFKKREFEKLPDISSTTKLYSKHANRSAENFASFTSPLAAKTMVDIYGDENGRWTETSNNSNAVKLNYDYDDSFTKLLISNGILRPDNVTSKSTTSAPVGVSQPANQNSNTQANPSVEDINRIMGGRVAAGVIRNNKESKNPVSSGAPDAEATWKESTKQSTDASTNVPTLPQDIPKKSPEPETIEDPIPSKPWLSNHRNSVNDDITSRYSDTESTINYDFASESTNSTDHTTNVSATDEVRLIEKSIVPLLMDRPEHIYALPDENELNFSASSPTEQHQKPIVENVTENFETTEGKRVASSSEFSRAVVSNENPLVAKLYTPAEKKMLDTTTVDELTVNEESKPKPVILIKSFPANIENYPSDFMPTFDELRSNRVHEIEKKSSHTKGNRMSVGEFKALVEHAVRRLFFPLARYLAEGNLAIVGKNPQSVRWDDRVMLKRFGFVTLQPVSTGREHGQEARNWTLLSGHERVNLTTAVDKLFYEDEDDVRWLVLLSPNATIERVRNNFFEYLASSSMAKLSLEYHGCKISALLAVPRRLMEKVSLPGNKSSIEVNEELQLEGPTAGDNVSLELSGRRYRVFELLTSRWSQRGERDEKLQSERVVDTKHDDIELYIFVFLGAICTFGILSPLLYGVYRLIQSYTTNVTFKIPSIFRDKFHYENHEKMPESRCESLNVIFSEEFDRKYSSWFDNSQHSSSILKASADGSNNSFFNDKLDDFPEFSDLTRNVCENSPRLNKENKVNMGCRGTCVLLPHPATYLMQSETEERYFDNPNYNNQETR